MSAGKQQYILAIDQGTTSTRAMLFNALGEIIALQQRELALEYPQAGWVEQRPEHIWRDSLWAMQSVYVAHPEALSATAALGITNQRETTIVWDRDSGEPIYNAIVWQDRRTASQCSDYVADGVEPMVTKKTGLLLDPYFSATKVAWILDHVSGARDRAAAGKLAFGTVDSFLLWHLTGGSVHATDASNAARTLLFNIVDQCWDEELLALFDIPAAMLPEVRDNATDFGLTAKDLLGESIPIAAMAGDQHAAMVGQACFEKGMIKSTYGTGCFALMNTGESIAYSSHRLLTTLAYRLNGVPTYALEGSIFNAGTAVQWLRDGLGIIENASESEALATSVPDNGGVYFVPALTGLGAPHWRPDLKGTISGIARDTSAGHIVRATLEAQAYQTRDLLAAMSADVGYQPTRLRVDGGLVANKFVCQFLADMLTIEIGVPDITEATAWGAASLAGLQCGMYSSLDDIAAVWKQQRSYQPDMQAEQVARLYAGWERALKGLLTGDA